MVSMRSLVRENIVSILTIGSLIMLPLWMLYSKFVVVTHEPIKLYEYVHPSYYIGFVLLIIASIIVLFIKKRKNVLFSHPLFIALLIATYMQLPSLAIFRYPLSDHTHHVTPIYHIIRNHNIDWPNYLGHRETVSPQLLLASLMMIINNYSVFMIHELSLILLPALTIIYAYLLSKEAVLDSTKASLSAVFTLTLACQLFYFLRQTYTFPLYILIGYLIMKLLKNRKYLVPLMILILAFISMDPAFVLVIIMGLLVFPVLYYMYITFIGKSNAEAVANNKGLYLAMAMAIILFGLYMLWIYSRYPYMPYSLYHIVEHSWNIAIRALHEPSILTSGHQYYWGRPIALAYDYYYSILYKFKVLIRATSIGLGSLVTLLVFLRKKIREVKYLLILSYFMVSVAIIVSKSYGATFAPWTAVMCWIIPVFSAHNKVKKKGLFKQIASSVIAFLIFILVLVSAMLVPHIINVPGQRISVADLHLSLYLGIFALPDFCITIPFPGYDLDQITYIIGGCRFNSRLYIPYEGLSKENINRIAGFKNVVLAETMNFKFLERTKAIYFLPMFLDKLTNKLLKKHSLVYMSGTYNTIWVNNSA